MTCISRIFLLLSILITAPSVLWSYDIDLGPIGHLCDTCGGGVIGGLPLIGHPLNEAQAQISGNMLEQWIIDSRNNAISGAMPIPDQIRQQLTGYASEDSMNRVRYKIGDSGFLNLARVIEQAGPALAVTLIDVVIFRGPTEAQSPSLWAHELTHVDQYRDWGVHSFAIQYARDFGAVEAPAYERGNGYSLWRQQQNSFQSSFQPQASQGALGAFCHTAVGRFGPGPIQPFGVQCFVNTYQGVFYGIIGP